MENYTYNRTPADKAKIAIRRLRRSNRRKSIWITILTVIVLILVAAIAIIIWRQHKKDFLEPTIEYISMTEEASARAYVWLNQIENNDLTYEDVKSLMGNFNLEVIKNPTKVKGEYEYMVEEGAYDYCVIQAKVGFERAYKEVIKNRIIETGYTADVSDDLVEQLMVDTFGMNVSEYLNNCNVKLLPELNEIDLAERLERDDEKGLSEANENENSEEVANEEN